MDYPLISIIITTYNYGHTLENALDSACNQSYPHIEIIVLDNASTDATMQVMEKYTADPRIRYIRNRENIGATPNHNKGIRESRGEYIHFLSADDQMKSESLSITYSYLKEQPNIDIPYTEIEFIDMNGTTIAARHSLFPAGYNGSVHEFPQLLSYGCYIAFETLLVHRSLWERYGLLDESLTAADYEIVVRWAEAGLRFGYIPYSSLQFRIHDKQDSGPQNYLASGKSIKELLVILNKHVTPENLSKINGFEDSILRNVQTTYALAREHGFHDDGTIAEHIETFTKAIGKIRRYHQEQPFVPQLSIIILATDSVAAINASLYALTHQTFQDWEVLVVHPSGLPIGPVHDPSGRIKLVSLYATIPEGHALNTAIQRASGNCFAFLRAGNTFNSEHCEQLLHLFEHHSPRLILTPARLMLHTPTSDEALMDFPDPHHSNALIVALSCPLESIAITRQLCDRIHGFTTSSEVFAQWDLLLRLREKERSAILEHSMVFLHEQIGEPNSFAQQQNLLETCQKIYRTFSTDHPEIQQARDHYLHELEALIATKHQRSYTRADHLEWYEKVSGRRLAQRYGVLKTSHPVPSVVAS